MSTLAWIILIFVVLFCWRAIVWGFGLTVGIIFGLIGALFVLGGCATGPLTYEEIEQAAIDTQEAYLSYDYMADNELSFKQTAKAYQRARQRLSTFEENVKKGEMLFAHKAQCQRQDSTIWFCPRGTPHKQRRDEQLHEFVRRYKQERDSKCGCADSQAVVESMQRML